jgi:hypothetical protein
MLLADELEPLGLELLEVAPAGRDRRTASGAARGWLATWEELIDEGRRRLAAMLGPARRTTVNSRYSGASPG